MTASAASDTRQGPMPKSPEEVLAILRREIRLVCKVEGSDTCECIWRVKPGNLEYIALLITSSVRFGAGVEGSSSLAAEPVA
jgi:hypothetical protein